MTGIQWTERVWNPTTGCDKVSPGCDNCYALKMAKRLKGMGARKYQRDGDPKTSGPGFGITEHPDALAGPLSWRKPSMVFVNSMSDLFHADVSDDFIACVWAVMAFTQRHTYQVLTKRHARMRSLLSSPDWHDRVLDAGCDLMDLSPDGRDYLARLPWPLPNVHLGVSAENQQWADIRIPALMDTPAAVRWVSAEPLLGPIDLRAKDDGTRNWLTDLDHDVDEGYPRVVCSAHGNEDCHRLYPHLGCAHLDWVVVGGESGPGARPMRTRWVGDVVSQCQQAGVPVFVKQLGSEWARDTYAKHSKGGDPDEWPEDLRVREYPQAVPS